MTLLSQHSDCHKQNKHDQAGIVLPIVRRNPIISIGRFLRSGLSFVSRSRLKQKPDYSASLNHLSEYQLRDIGFTRDPPDRRILDLNIGFLQSGLHAQRGTRIRRLPKG